MQDNCNQLISNEYSEKTRRSMAMLSEKEHSFELFEVIVSVVLKAGRDSWKAFPCFASELF